MEKEESKQEGYICPHTKIQCDDECCVSAEDCHITSSLASGMVDCDEPKQEICEHIKEYGCIKDICTCNTGPKQETLEETALEYASEKLGRIVPIYKELDANVAEYVGFINGAKWMQEQMEKLKDFDTWKEWKNRQQ
jgi:hypothetical protein